ncbi:MAG: hypothetical protein HZA92_18845 [Verrucomicrobia bacterium]|nr:hypothetical protein [Verrucomicrobiota bacterium]
MKSLLFSVCALALMQLSSPAQDSKTPAVVPAKEAKSKVGETIVVEGKVAEVSKNERIIRLNLGAKYPKQDFTLVIFPRNFELVPDVEKLVGKTVRASGKVAEFQGRPQIVLERKDQLSVPADTKPDEKKSP